MCEHEFVNMMEGTTIHGKYIHVYQCVRCGLFDYAFDKKFDLIMEKIALEVYDNVGIVQEEN